MSAPTASKGKGKEAGRKLQAGSGAGGGAGDAGVVGEAGGGGVGKGVLAMVAIVGIYVVELVFDFLPFI